MIKSRQTGLWILVLGLILVSFELRAQVAVRIALNRINYILYENIFAKVELRNYSGRTIVFGENESLKGKLEFNIVLPDTHQAMKSKKAFNPIAGMVLKPGATEEVIVPLNRIYMINKVGRYTARAVVSHHQFRQSYQSNSINFTVVNGMAIWERLVGMADIMNKKNEKVIESRRVKILTFFDGRKKVYCLTVENDHLVFGVVRLGYDIGNFPPQIEVDGLSRIHILIQVSPQIFGYYIYDLDCKLDEKEVFVRAKTSPQLARDPKEGTVMVLGGKKAVKNIDYVENDGKAVAVPVSPAP